MFKVTKGSGFQMKFANGWTVSVQWGGGTYSSNYSQDAGTPQAEALSAEVAAWDRDGNWYQFGEYEEVKGYLTSNEVLTFMHNLATGKPNKAVKW